MVNKVRVSLSLDPEVAEQLRLISRGTGKPVSSFVNEILLSSMPHLKTMTDAMLLISSDPSRAMKLILDASDDAAGQFSKITNEIKEKSKPKTVKRRA